MKRLEKYIEHIKNLNISNWEDDENTIYKIEEFLTRNNEYNMINKKV